MRRAATKRVAPIPGRHLAPLSAPSAPLKKLRPSPSVLYSRSPFSPRPSSISSRVSSWRNSRVDRFIAALALGSLHGEMDKSKAYFSNQMPRTISTKPKYSVNFWEKRDLWPEPRDVFFILKQRLDYRFASPRPVNRGKAFLSDIRDLSRIAPELKSSVNLVITSPPYLNVTNFKEDQWLRLWFLGGCPRPRPGLYSRDDRYERPEMYWKFLCDAWRAIRPPP
jgi:hypothetical protein